MNDLEPYIVALKIVEDSCDTFSNAIQNLQVEYEIYRTLYETKKSPISEEDIDNFGINISNISSIVEKTYELINQMYSCIYSPNLDEEYLAFLSKTLNKYSSELKEETIKTQSYYQKLHESAQLIINKNIH
jgi:hypothetical protein